MWEVVFKLHCSLDSYQTQAQRDGKNDGIFQPPGQIIVPAKDPGRIKRGRPVSNPDVVKYVTATNIDLNDDEFDENSLQRFC